MDYGKILARAFEITYKYRALWLFGFLLSLFGGSNSFNPSNFTSGTSSRRDTPFDRDVLPNLPPNFEQYIAVIVIALICVALIWMLLGIIARFLSRGAVIGLVQELEANGTTPTVRRGFNIGSSRFWQLLGISIVINLPLMVFSFAVILLAILPIAVSVIPMLSRGSRDVAGGLLAGGIITSIGFFCCAILCLMAVTLVIRPFFEFIVRVCVIEKRGVFDSIRDGYHIVRKNLGNVVILYLLLIGVGIGFGLLMIPVSLLLVAIPLGVGVVAYVASQSIVTAFIVGGIIAIPFVLILIFIDGLYQVFDSAVWTEGYLSLTKPNALVAPVVTPATAS
ncbi:MAG: hypothetical protein HZB51_06110 [Chloroflexi bacterium]|nr:hypothetical protein [Chloroflexota bacterium]